MGESILPPSVRCSLDGNSARRAALHCMHARDTDPRLRRNRQAPPAAVRLERGPGGRPAVAEPDLPVQGLHARGRADQPDRAHRGGGGPPPGSSPDLWLAAGRPLDPRRGWADRERLCAGGQDRPDPGLLTAFHTFFTAIPLLCRHLTDTVFRLDALPYLLGAPPKGARGAPEGDPPLGHRRGGLLLSLRPHAWARRPGPPAAASAPAGARARPPSGTRTPAPER